MKRPNNSLKHKKSFNVKLSVTKVLKNQTFVLKLQNILKHNNSRVPSLIMSILWSAPFQCDCYQSKPVFFPTECITIFVETLFLFFFFLFCSLILYTFFSFSFFVSLFIFLLFSSRIASVSICCTVKNIVLSCRMVWFHVSNK